MLAKYAMVVRRAGALTAVAAAIMVAVAPPWSASRD